MMPAIYKGKKRTASRSIHAAKRFLGMINQDKNSSLSRRILQGDPLRPKASHVIV